MFARSGKARSAFYEELHVEDGLEVVLGNVQFGEGALTFKWKVERNVHREHLIVLYSVKLLRACASLNPGAPFPTKNVVESFYQYFEERISHLMERFDLYHRDSHAAKAILQLLLPQPAPKGLFYGIRYNNRSNLKGYFAPILDRCMARYAENFARRAAGELSPLEALYAYLALCQSSGFGKSSLVAALKPSPENVIFDICLRAENSPGEPGRTHLVAKLMEECASPTDFLAIIVACLEAIKAEMQPNVRKSSRKAIFRGETPVVLGLGDLLGHRGPADGRELCRALHPRQRAHRGSG